MCFMNQSEKRIRNNAKSLYFGRRRFVGRSRTVALAGEHDFEVKEIPHNHALPQEEVYDFIREADAVIAGAERYDSGTAG